MAALLGMKASLQLFVRVLVLKTSSFQAQHVCLVICCRHQFLSVDELLAVFFRQHLPSSGCHWQANIFNICQAVWLLKDVYFITSLSSFDVKTYVRVIAWRQSWDVKGNPQRSIRYAFLTTWQKQFCCTSCRRIPLISSLSEPKAPEQHVFQKQVHNGTIIASP